MLSRTRTGSTKFVKQLNRKDILQLLKQKSMSRADLAKETRLSRPCISALVDEMIREGWIFEAGIGKSRGGRKPILLDFNSQAFAVAGAIFEGSELQLAIADLKGSILARYRTHLAQPNCGETALQELESGLKVLLKDSGTDKNKLLGMGVGLPGITQRRSGTISYAPSTGWMGLPVQKEIEERLGLPVIIDNDVNMMALGEYYEGVGAAFSNLVYMYVGTGIGAGIVLDGQLYRGSTEAAGEIGYMMIGAFGSRQFGDYGVFEQNYALPGIFQKARAIYGDSVVDESDSAVKQLAVRARNGDNKAEALLKDIFKHWTFGMANVLSVLNPELLILSGEMVHIHEEGLQEMMGQLASWVPVVPNIRKASLGQQAGIVGAVHCVLESVSDQMPLTII